MRYANARGFAQITVRVFAFDAPPVAPVIRSAEASTIVVRQSRCGKRGLTKNIDFRIVRKRTGIAQRKIRAVAIHGTAFAIQILRPKTQRVHIRHGHVEPEVKLGVFTSKIVFISLKRRGQIDVAADLGVQSKAVKLLVTDDIVVKGREAGCPIFEIGRERARAACAHVLEINQSFKTKRATTPHGRGYRVKNQTAIQ